MVARSGPWRNTGRALTTTGARSSPITARTRFFKTQTGSELFELAIVTAYSDLQHASVRAESVSRGEKYDARLKGCIVCIVLFHASPSLLCIRMVLFGEDGEAFFT